MAGPTSQNKVLESIYLGAATESLSTSTNRTGVSILATPSNPVGSTPYFLADDPANGYVYVSNYASGNVTVINGATNKIVTSIEIGSGSDPLRPTYDPRNSLLYVPEAAQSDIAIVNTLTDAVTQFPVTSGAYPHSALYNPLNGLVYVPCYYGGLYILNGSTQVAEFSEGTDPVNAVYDSGNGLVYVANQGSNTVTIFNGTTYAGVSLATQAGPNFLTYDPVNGYIYIDDGSTDIVSVLNGAAKASNNLVTSVVVGTTPAWPLYDPATGYVYVPNEGSANVTVLDNYGHVTGGNVALSTTPFFGTLDTANGMIYVPDYGSGKISVINATTFAVQSVATGTDPRYASFDPANGDVYVANSGSSNVSVIATAAVVSGYVYLSTPSMVSKGTPVYGAEVYIQGRTITNVTGPSGAYAIAVATTLASVTVCAQAPGLQEASGGFASWSTGTPECDSVAVTMYQTTQHTLLLRFDSTGLTPEGGTSPVYANLDQCYVQGSSSCPSSTGVWYRQVDGLTSDMTTDLATTVSASSVSSVPLAPDCSSSSTCNYVAFSGTVTESSEAASTYWEVLPLGLYGQGTGVPLSSPMQIVYNVYASESPTTCLPVSIDVAFSDGTWLRYIQNNLGSYILDGNGNRIAPADQCISSGWHSGSVDLSEVNNKTIAYIAVGFASASATAGSFQAYFSGIELLLGQQASSIVNGDFTQGAIGSEGSLNGWLESGNYAPTAIWPSSPPPQPAPNVAAALVGSVNSVSAGNGYPYVYSNLTQEFRVPNDIDGGSVCLRYTAATNDPTPSLDYQRAYIEDRTTGAKYYLVGSATSSAFNEKYFSQSCLNITGGADDLRGDRVWIVLTVAQSVDGYSSYAVFTDIAFTPDDLGFADDYSGASQNSYGFSGADIPLLEASTLTFSPSHFPASGSAVTYDIPFSTGGAVWENNTPSGSSAWHLGIQTGISLTTLTRNPSTGVDTLDLELGASAVVGQGSSTPPCYDNLLGLGATCLFVDQIRLGIEFGCQSGCGSQFQVLAGSPAQAGGAWGWNLAPVCGCSSSSSGNGLTIGLDMLGIALGIAGVIAGAPFTGGTTLVALPELLGLAGVVVSGVQLGVDLTSTTSGLSGSGESCTNSQVPGCDSYDWGDLDDSVGGTSTGAATMLASVQAPENAGTGTDFTVVAVAQLQIGEAVGFNVVGGYPIPAYTIPDYATINTADVLYVVSA